MPSTKVIYEWLRIYKDFRDNYVRAKDDQADTYADQIVHIADNADPADPAAVNKARLQVEARKWVASKLKPKKYGDKIDHTTDGRALPQPILAMLTTQATENTTRDVIDIEQNIPERDSAALATTNDIMADIK